MTSNGADGFDRWLDQELQSQVSSENAPNPMPSQARYQAVALQAGSLSALAALASTKVGAAVVVSALALGSAGVATEAAITGSANPIEWGQQVREQVEKCKAALSPGSHGVGECVSSFASRKGSEESAANKASAARDQQSGPPRGHPGGPPSSRPGGPPSSQPGGPPSSHPAPGRKPTPSPSKA